MGSVEEAELIGMHVGDGTLYKTSRGLVWELRGNPANERGYYDGRVTYVLEAVFKTSFKPKYRSGGTYGIQTSLRQVAEFFLRRGFGVGAKAHSVRVPPLILHGTSGAKIAFLRGLFDTDGSVYVERSGRGQEYVNPRVNFGSASRGLLEDVKGMLKEFGFNSHIPNDRGGNYRVIMGGWSTIEKFFGIIKPANPRNIDRYERFVRLKKTLGTSASAWIKAGIIRPRKRRCQR